MEHLQWLLLNMFEDISKNFLIKARFVQKNLSIKEKDLYRCSITEDMK